MTNGLRARLQLDSAGLTFWMRIAAWLMTPVFYSTLSHDAAFAILITWIVASVVIDIIAGNTFWLRLHPLVLVVQILYLGLVAGIWISDGTFLWTTWGLLVFLVFLSASDLITRAMRILILVNLCWIIFLEAWWLSGSELPKPTDLLWPTGANIAAFSRVFWPRSSEGLLQTSLDYGRCRIEIISYGMKKALAIGLRRSP